MTNRTKRTLHLAAVMVATMLSFVGCAADSSPGELDEHAIEALSPLDLGDNGVPGEDPDARRGDKARNCAYVQWCDEPNSPRGTICKVYARCRPVNAVTAEEYWQECKRDVKAVCGAPTYPFWYLPNE